MIEMTTATYCKVCYIYFRDASDRKRHQLTSKHKKNAGLEKAVSIKNKQHRENQRYQCDKCTKHYKYQSGLSKHKNNIHGIEDMPSQNDNVMSIMKDILKTQLSILTQQQKHSASLMNVNHIVNQGVYIDKQVVNINVYLNEKCNNAISLIDFINNLNLTLDDLKQTQSLGYVNGVSNILVNKLVSLKPTERPIHCDETGKEFEFYIKEDSNWMKDIDSKRIDWSIENITKKQIEMLTLWEKSHPNWMNSDNELETYLEMVKLCMGGSCPNEIERNKVLIKRALANGVKIEDILCL